MAHLVSFTEFSIERDLTDKLNLTLYLLEAAIGNFHDQVKLPEIYIYAYLQLIDFLQKVYWLHPPSF